MSAASASIESIDQVLRDAVESGAVPNATAIAADRDGIIYEGGAGPRVAGQDGDQVGVDTHCRIMSMTKMLCTLVALQLRERGALDFDSAVQEYCPQFGDLQVLEGFDGDTPRLRPPARQATVRQLVTHTAGLGYWFWNADLVRWEAATGTPNVLSGSNVVFTAPLVGDPGTKFEYGINTHFWVDREAGITGSIYTQFLPFVTEEAFQMYVDFEEALYASR